MSKKAKLYVKVTNPEGLVFGGNAYMVSSINKVGKFDVLPDHIHFITTISQYLKIQTENKELKQIDFEQGLLKVKDNVVDVYIGV